MLKILIIRFSSIGDIVLTSPVIRCLKMQLENVELHILTKSQYVSLWEANPYIDQIHAWEKNDEAVISTLKKMAFDVVVDLHKNIRTARIKSQLKRKSYSFPKLNVQKWLYVNLKWNRLPDVHIVDRYFEAVTPLGVKNDNAGLDFFIDLDLKSFKERFNYIEPYIVVAIGAKFATKKMPVEQLSEVLKDWPLPIVLIGGSEDRKEAEELRRLLPGQLITNTCGGFTLQESAQIIKDALLLITHDTGMMHVGSAFDLPIVSIWGNTVPEFGMFPYRPQKPDSFSIHEVKNLSCRPCSKIGFQKCPKKHFKCMKNQDISAIRTQINHFLDHFLRFR